MKISRKERLRRQTQSDKATGNVTYAKDANGVMSRFTLNKKRTGYIVTELPPGIEKDY